MSKKRFYFSRLDYSLLLKEDVIPINVQWLALQGSKYLMFRSERGTFFYAPDRTFKVTTIPNKKNEWWPLVYGEYK